MPAKTRTILLYLLAISSLFACKERKRVYSIKKIEIASDGGFLPHRGHVLVFDDSLNCYFYGDKYFQKHGHFKGKISNVFWEEIIQKLEKANYRLAPLTDSINTPDVEYLEAVIHTDSDKKRFLRCVYRNKDRMSKTLKWLSDQYKLLDTHTSTDIFTFTTTIQNPTPISPGMQGKRISLPKNK